MDSGQPDRPTCPIRDRLEKNLYEAVRILARHSVTLVDLAGTEKLDEINETTRLIENQRLLIQELGKQIGLHREEHGC